MSDEVAVMSMQNNVRQKITWIVILVMFFMLLSCSKEGGSVSDSKGYFEVIDSRILAIPDEGGQTHWLNNEKVVFQGFGQGVGAIENKKKRERSILVFDIKNRTTRVLVEGATLVCLDDDTLYYHMNNEAGREHGILRKTTVKEDQSTFVLISGKQYRSKNYYLKRDPHCGVGVRGDYSQEHIASLKRFDAELRKVWLTDRYLSEVEKRSLNERFEVFFTSKNIPKGKSIMLASKIDKPKGMQYIPYKNQYLFFVTKRNEDHIYLIEGHYLLAMNGDVKRLLIPDEWGESRDIKITKSGVVVAFNDIRKKERRPGDQGLYLMIGKSKYDVVELLQGYVKGLSMSPDGCMLATAHFRKIIPMKSNNGTLKVVNLCKKESEK